MPHRRRDKIFCVKEFRISADELAASLLRIGEGRSLCLLDSSGVGHLGSHLLIAGVDPVETGTIFNAPAADTLERLQELVSRSDRTVIFTLSYEFGMRLNGLLPGKYEPGEPDVFYAVFDTLVTHDYNTGRTFVSGSKEKFDRLIEELSNAPAADGPLPPAGTWINYAVSEREYIDAVEAIIEEIRSGNTYQTNYTMRVSADVSGQRSADIFRRLRMKHPAPFAAFIDRGDSTVISASPERFVRIRGKQIDTSPIKGTRKRSSDPAEDALLRAELLASKKDRAENIMIVDLLRNDIGRVCEFGSVRVEKLCDIEEHPSLFHLVSTVSGRLRSDADITETMPAVFPCGSITGAPKISTMKIIDKLERTPRGLSMGAFGININDGFGVTPRFDTSVAIRTMVVRDGVASFNVGGGITIDSDPHAEYEEALLKAKALIKAIGKS